jgi:hypothetical protein
MNASFHNGLRAVAIALNVLAGLFWVYLFSGRIDQWFPLWLVLPLLAAPVTAIVALLGSAE